MILYLDQWRLYPTAIVHNSTKNKSFVRLANIYRSFGVKNHAFMLALINPLLEHVDPHDPTISLEQMSMVTAECKVNPWYYFREVARAPAQAGSGAVPMDANRGNIALYWLFFNHVMTILIQIRQTGKSFSTDTLMTYLLNIAADNTQINLLTKDDSLRRANIQRIKDIFDELPPYLLQKTKDDANNTEEITVLRKNNYYKTHVPQSSPKNAEKVGRGLTSPIFHIDEAPFQPHIEVALPAALAATGAAADKAKAAGGHYGTILTTTAGKIDDRDGLYVYNMVQGSAVWSETFLDCHDQEDLYKTIRNNSRDRLVRVNITLNHRQLGKTDEWLLEKLESSNAQGDAANRDYFNMWTAGSQTSPLPLHLLEAIRNSVEEPSFTEKSTHGGFVTRWYIPKDSRDERMASRRYSLGMDTSEASKRDDVTIYVQDSETYETICCAAVNEANLLVISRWIAEFLRDWPTVVANIERKSTGVGIIDYLLIHLPNMNIDPFRRLFNMVVNDRQENPSRFEEMQRLVSRRDPYVYEKYKQCFGFTTAGQGLFARSNLYGPVLQQAAKVSASKVYDKKLADQITALVEKNGRVDHPPGGHDDMVIAWLLSNWLLSQARNIEYYGFSPERIGSLSFTNADQLPEVVEAARLQRDLREQLRKLTEDLSKCKDVWVSQRIEQKIRKLTEYIVPIENEILNVDEMIRQAKENKRVNRYSDSSNRRPDDGWSPWRKAA